VTPEQAFEIACQQTHACFLCGSPHLARIGCYVPRDAGFLSVAMSPPTADQQRTYWYGICHQCFAAGETAVASRVEERLLAMRDGQRN
jgi:hypothetical protein